MFHGQDDNVARIPQDVDCIVVRARRYVHAVHFNYRVADKQLARCVRRLVLVDPAWDEDEKRRLENYRFIDKL